MFWTLDKYVLVAWAMTALFYLGWRIFKLKCLSRYIGGATEPKTYVERKIRRVAQVYEQSWNLNTIENTVPGVLLLFAICLLVLNMVMLQSVLHPAR